jgi:ribosomal protein S18 acetylase RimI-like enzyme
VNGKCFGLPSKDDKGVSRLQIRVATQQDLTIIRRFEKIVQEEATVGYLKQSDDVPNIKANFGGNSYYFVAIHQGVFLGWILVGETYHPFKNELSGIILEIYILHAHRGKGYAKKLMKYALNYLKQRGFKAVQLNVFSGNPAYNMYKALGFSDISIAMEKKL